jgi:glycerophosphoryl diester phosphodiesterase
MLEVLASKRGGYPTISGHRGAAGYAPENTMAAFSVGWQREADLLELNVQFTRDGHVVVIHDSSLERTTRGTGWVGDKTLEELRTLDAGSWYGPAFSGERIPTLDEVVAWAKGRIRLNIEATTACSHSTASATPSL